jgi:AraC family transcriptional regulator
MPADGRRHAWTSPVTFLHGRASPDSTLPAVHSPPGTSSELAHRARAMIASHSPHRIQAGEIARRLGCSVSRLSRMFSRAHGTTLTAYRLEMQLREATRLLEDDPAADLTEVALSSGFSSHSHFTAVFRQHLGCTPSAFAARLVTCRVAPEQTPASAAPCGTCNR